MNGWQIEISWSRYKTGKRKACQLERFGMTSAEMNSRQAIANTISQFFGISVDPNKHTWVEMSELYQRLCCAESLKKYHGVDVDWKTKTAEELRGIFQEMSKGVV